jgi:hypothetical protein
MQYALERKQYILLGRLVASRYPGIADELLTPLNEQEARDSDLSRLASYFISFFELQSFNPEDYRGPSQKNSFQSEMRRVFVGVMLHYYCPTVFKHNKDISCLPYGFVRSLSRVLNIGQASSSRLIQEVIVLHRAYDEFEQKVSDMLKRMTA